jgi:formylglycine-generating enzyme required for sulfatase activity
MNPSKACIAETFKAGDKLAGCYTLKETLPPQGCCCVWLAHDEELNKDIVLHFVPDSVAADTRAMSELKQEAKRNRQLIHPRIIRIHDLVEDEKWAAISMDHVPGETLAALQKKRPKNALNPPELATGIAELCQTLEDAHRIELFHRDLTPENIVATANGVMVQKFGIARVILDSLTRSGQAIEGSRDVAYISPQQLDGERPSRADDIYSLGASIFDLLTGMPPFHEGDLIPQIRKDVPPTVSERRAAQGITDEPVPKAWDETIAASLSKNPEERPKSAAEAGSRFASGKPGSASAAALVGAAAVAGAAAEAASKPDASAKPPQAPPEQESVKQQKRPWSPGPGKAPVIAEATVLSKTAVPKGDAKGEPKGEPKAEPGKESTAAKPPEPPAAGAKKGGPTTPTGFPLRAFVEVEGESKRAKAKSSGGLITVAVMLGLIMIVTYIVYRSNGGSGPQPENSVALTGSNAESVSGESTATPTPVDSASPAVGGATPVNVAPVNVVASNIVSSDTTASTAAASATPATPTAPEASATPAPAASATPEITQAPTPAPSAPPAIPIAELAAMPDAQADQLVADKTKAVDQAKAALADAEKAAQDKAVAQTQAASAVQALQAQIKQKADAAAAAKTAADAAATSLKQQQDTLQKAQADADAAQKEAAAKAQAADQLRRTLQDAQASAQQQQATEQQAIADADQLAKTVADREQAADAAAKAAADAEKARQQQAQALSLAQTDLTQVQTGLAQARDAAKARQAAEAAARLQKQREEETARLTAQAASAAKAAQDAQKALDAAKQAVADAEKAQAEAEREAAAARNGSLPLSTPAASPAPSAPAATPPAGASASPAVPIAPTLSVHAPKANLKVDQALSNSLGMRFAPVGHVFFSIWLTRVQDFDAFARATGYKGTEWQDPGFKQAPDHPVVDVSWNDANQFCLWLTEKEHREGILAANETYRLPTDLEWSNAVGLPPETTGRTPESRDMDVPDVYPWGTQWPPPPGAGNYTGEETDSDVAIKGYNDGFAWTSPVGSFTVNKFGLYDMGGNVWEWCEDWWNSEQKARVLRGASWYNGALKLSLLSSCRNEASADQRSDNYGFRVIVAQEMAKGAKHRTDD